MVRRRDMFRVSKETSIYALQEMFLQFFCIFNCLDGICNFVEVVEWKKWIKSQKVGTFVLEMPFLGNFLFSRKIFGLEYFPNGKSYRKKYKNNFLGNNWSFPTIPITFFCDQWFGRSKGRKIRGDFFFQTEEVHNNHIFRS